MKTFPFGQKTVWQPNTEWISDSNLQRFMDTNGIASYDQLLERSSTDITWFWNAVLRDLNIQFYRPYTSVVDYSKDIRFPKWCINGQMNIIHNCLDKWQKTQTAKHPALIYESENGTVKQFTYKDLYKDVERCAAGLKTLGLGKNDAIGLYMPMVPELAIAFLAIIKIGGVILPLFSGYGPAAISTRLNDAGAKALFTCDGFFRRGKIINMKETADQALKDCPTVRHVIISPNAGREDFSFSQDRDVLWVNFVRPDLPGIETEHTSAEDACMIIYTSGTTGRPKGAVHTHCGFPVKAAQDMFHCMDLKPGEVMYWMTDMGWMMGPWLVFGSLLIGATMVFYDGAPDYPDYGRLWKMVQNHGVTHLGVSPTLVRTLKEKGTDYLTSYDVSSLRMVGSTGSPWDPDSWIWLFENVLQSSKPIINYSGGTEISGGIVCGNFFKPLKPCAFSGPVPGMAADVVDENGEPVTGQVGELVIRKPWIGMTRGFWKDKQRYIDTYWSRFENTWLHGDFAAIDEDGLWYILGRSDDTIKIAGKRLGPAEVESLLNAHKDVIESAAIAVPHPVKDNEVIAFCVLNDGVDADEKLRNELINQVTNGLGKALKPGKVLFTKSLPKTRNAKVMHRLIRSVYLHLPIGDTSSLENPGTLNAIKNAI